MTAKLSVLRACRRLLRPGGRTAYLTIFIAPDLTEPDRGRAEQAGPPAVASPHDQQTLLHRAGFVEIAEQDMTSEYRDTARAWLEESERFASELRAALGEPEFDERQQERRAALAAIEGGLLRRSLFTAVRGGRTANRS
ncbi:MAG: hypothetical protein ACE5KX_07970 [Acidimicrobiia bacterium]